MYKRRHSLRLLYDTMNTICDRIDTICVCYRTSKSAHVSHIIQPTQLVTAVCEVLHAAISIKNPGGVSPNMLQAGSIVHGACMRIILYLFFMAGGFFTFCLVTEA